MTRLQKREFEKEREDQDRQETRDYFRERQWTGRETRVQEYKTTTVKSKVRLRKR